MLYYQSFFLRIAVMPRDITATTPRILPAMVLPQPLSPEVVVSAEVESAGAAEVVLSPDASGVEDSAGAAEDASGAAEEESGAEDASGSAADESGVDEVSGAEVSAGSFS